MYPKKPLWAGAAVLLLCLTAGRAAAAEPVGRIIAVEGKPRIERAQGGLIELKLNDPVHIGDTIRTAAGRAKIMFDDNTLMTIGDGSEIKITEYMYNPATQERASLFDLVSGKVKTLVGKLFSSSNNFRVRTPTAVAGVRGTYFRVDVDNDTNVVVFDGEVDVEDRNGNTLSLQGGFSLNIGRTGLAGEPQQLTPRALSQLERTLDIRLQDQLNRSSGGSINLAALARDAVAAARPAETTPPPATRDDDGPDLDEIADRPRAGDPLDRLESVDPKINDQLRLRLTFPEGVVR